MFGPLFIFPLFIASCISAFFRPYLGLLGFYAFVFLEPEWNWRWAISPDWNFQKYIAVCVLIGVLLNGFRGNQFRGWFAWSITGILSFLGLAWISSQQTVDPVLTEFYLVTIAKVIVIAVVTARIVDTPAKCFGLLWVIAICQGYNAYQINEHYFKTGVALFTYRAWGFKGDNNLYSNFTVPAMAAAAALTFYSPKNWQKMVAGIIFLLQVHQLMLMGSRGCMLGALLMCALCVWFMPKTQFNKRAVIAVTLLGAALAGPSVVKEFSSAFASEDKRDSSADSRFTLWKAGFEITMDYPLLGVGPYAGQRLVPQYAPEFSHKFKKGLHNLFFEISTGCGLPATTGYFAFFLLPWWAAFKLSRRRDPTIDYRISAGSFALVVGVPGYLLASMFSSGALLESSYALVACGAAAIAMHQRSSSESATESLANISLEPQFSRKVSEA